MARHFTEKEARDLTRVLVKAYKGGASIRDAAAEAQTSYGVAHRLLHIAAEAGKVTIRPRTRPAAK